MFVQIRLGSGIGKVRSRLLEQLVVEGKEIGVVIIGFKDRLTRFGFKYLERYFTSHNVRIEVGYA